MPTASRAYLSRFTCYLDRTNSAQWRRVNSISPQHKYRANHGNPPVPTAHYYFHFFCTSGRVSLRRGKDSDTARAHTVVSQGAFTDYFCRVNGPALLRIRADILSIDRAYAYRQS